MSAGTPGSSRAPIVVAAAMGLELRPLLRHLTAVAPDPDLGRGVWRGMAGNTPLVVVRGGVGPVNAAASAARLLERLGTTGGVINAGIAGALNSDLAIGEVVVAGAGVNPAGEVVWSAAPELAERFGGAGPRRVVTVPKPAWTAAAKAALRNTSGADLCEMEGAAWATAAESFGIPFASVRAISDVAGHDLPDLGRLGDPSAPVSSLWRLAHPRVWWALPALARNAKTAAEAAAVFLVSNLTRA